MTCQRFGGQGTALDWGQNEAGLRRKIGRIWSKLLPSKQFGVGR